MTTETTAADVARGDRPAWHRIHGWHVHPGVRSNHELTFGERAADRMRNNMGSWGFVFGAIAFLAIWMLYNGVRSGGAFDKYPFILLNLVLSCLAAMQGAILLIAAKRSDQVAAELAQHDYETDSRAEQLIEMLSTNLESLREEHRQMRAQLIAVTDLLTKTTSP
ncbi:MAG TPA: DUF1003 domain-containing protein [Micromonosporaceae bacterium]|nr:DUF1003 domain-containing protein [Micromonosporaceae bacterium]